MSATRIEWATHVYNAFTGCDRLSAGCAHCYAIPTAAANQRRELGRARKAASVGKPPPRRRYFTDGDPRTSGPGFGFAVHWDKLERPERFPAGARVFVNSMSDVFHEQAPAEAIAALWRVFAARPDVDWLVLTKRAARMSHVLGGWRDAAEAQNTAGVPAAPSGDVAVPWDHWIRGLPNVWVGVTVENRSWVRRADLLRGTPAAVRFISAEPLLGPLVLAEFPERHRPRAGFDIIWADGHRGPELDLTDIDWLIAGGESGPRHRPVHVAWVRDLRDACLQTQTPFFFKQWGGRAPTSGGRDLDGRTWDDLPAAAHATPPRGTRR